MPTVTGIEPIPVEVSLKAEDEEGGQGAYGNLENPKGSQRVERMLIRLTTDEGVTGWGEMHTVPGYVIDANTECVLQDVIEPEVTGREVFDIQSFVSELSVNGSGPVRRFSNIEPHIAGVEMAMWDAWGKHLGVPVHQLLGGKIRDEVPFAYALGILSPEESREHARWAFENGFTVLKTKAGPDWRNDVARIEAMYDETDGELEFRLDPNQGYTLEDAVRVAASFEDAGIYLQYFEQPVRIDSFGTYKRLRERLRTPIAVNEDAYYPRNLFHLLKEDAIDVAVVDLLYVGGILGMKRAAGLADETGISLSHHSGRDLGVKTAAVLHAVATTPAINLPPDSVYYAYEDDVIKSPFEFEDGTLQVPDDPGLGVTVDEGKVDQRRID